MFGVSFFVVQSFARLAEELFACDCAHACVFVIQAVGMVNDCYYTHTRHTHNWLECKHQKDTHLAVAIFRGPYSFYCSFVSLSLIMCCNGDAFK